MPTFNELAYQPSYPIIFSKRSDGIILTAIKIPIDDVRLERWGWILTLSNKGIKTDVTDPLSLKDNDQQLYPKIYTQAEVNNYNEKWGFDNWEVGYNQAETKIHSTRTTKPLSTELLQKDILQETLEDIRSYQNNYIRNKIEAIHTHQLYQDASIHKIISDQIAPYLKNIDDLKNSIATYQSNLKIQLGAINENIAEANSHLSEIDTTIFR